MKKIKRLLLTLSLLISALLILSSCAKNPDRYEWFIDMYTKDGVIYDRTNPIQRLDHFNVRTSDKVKLSFNEDKTFSFSDYSGNEYRGTYEFSKKKISVSYKIDLKFENGHTATAVYTSRSGRHSRLDVEIFGVEYIFTNFDPFMYTTEEFNNDLKDIAVSVRDASRSKEQIVQYHDFYYYKGNVTEDNGKFYLSYAGIRHDLSNGCEIYPYYIDEKDNLSVKEGLSEGECIVRDRGGDYAIYYYSPNDSYIRESVGFGKIYSWVNELTLYDVSEITYVYDRGSLAPGHLQEARLASFAECEAIINYLKNTKLDYVAPENIPDPIEGKAIDFVIITAEDGEVYKLQLDDFYFYEGNGYKANTHFPAIADRGTNYVNIDTHLVYREIFKYGQKIANTELDLSYVILEPIDTFDGVDLDFTTDCEYVSDVTVNIIDARHVQYDGVLYEVVSEYDFSPCVSDIEPEKYSILTIKNAIDGSVLLNVKYDTGRALSTEDILSTALTGGENESISLYLDADATEELTELLLSSNLVIYVK
ncbi:MAG: hypothetical protein E7673_06185 [Ruminococcaceae bacterium]|nr:hypothetical protein [Oscillospiraceae bacterium]